MSYSRKGGSLLEQIIETLVACDKAGQELVQAARERQRTEKERVEHEKQEMYQRYLEREQERVRQYQAFSQEEKERKMRELKASYEEKRERLRTVYEQNAGRWADEMFRRCVEGSP